jgi:hypothetical protein
MISIFGWERTPPKMKRVLQRTRLSNSTTVRSLFSFLVDVRLLTFASETDLHGSPVQYREVQGYESVRFLSYFPRFVCLQGGIATGFHHVSAPPPLNLRKLYRIKLSRDGNRSSLVVREVAADGSSLVEGDVFVLDKGTQVLQYNTKTSAGQERFKAAEFVQILVKERKGQCHLTVYGKLFLKPSEVYESLTPFGRRRRAWLWTVLVRIWYLTVTTCDRGSPVEGARALPPLPIVRRDGSHHFRACHSGCILHACFR